MSNCAANQSRKPAAPAASSVPKTRFHAFIWKERLDRANGCGRDRREQVVERDLEDAVRGAGGAPDPLEAVERLVDDRRQIALVAERRHPADREAGRGASLVGRRRATFDLLDAAVARAEDHRRRVIDDEDERLDDLTELATARRCGIRRRACRV